MSGEARTGGVDGVTLTRGWLEWLSDTREGYLEALVGLSDGDRR